ncbi:MAG: hypothetical protein H8E37_00750 [Planctomycetes bacterium]|nr:hypothetical protein [Planctomycetota bacterium]
MKRIYAGAVIVAVAAGLLAFSLLQGDRDKPAGDSAPYSNIHQADYVGPDTCVECHPSQHSDWQTHSHGRMNLNPSPETVAGDFSDHRVDYGNGHVLFEEKDSDYFMSVYEDDTLSRQYRVTRTVGSRFTQMYIGLQTAGPEPEDHHAFRIEGKLPFGYWLKNDVWTPVTYFDSVYEAEPEGPSEKTALLAHAQQESKWELNCLYCHNTYPFQHRMHFGAALGFPREDYVFPGGTDVLEKWGALTPDKLVTLGISCESCHYGAREHVENGLPMKYVPSSAELTVSDLPPGDPASQASVINSICAQCHCAKVTLYPNGAATWNSREALDLKAGACAEQLKCTDCHNPHRSASKGGLFSDSQVISKCISCHDQFQDSEALSRHSRHSVDMVTCLDCHMPRIVQGLDSVIRTHHISSPTNERMLKPAGPNACNLCHLDRPIKWTTNALNDGWNSQIRPGAGWSSDYGQNFEKPLGEVWLNHSRPLMRLLVSDAVARSEGNRNMLKELLHQLREPYGINRMFGLFAVEKVIGRKLTREEYNPVAPQSARDEMVTRLIQQLVRDKSE